MAAAYEIQQQQTQQLRSDAESTSWRFRDARYRRSGGQASSIEEVSSEVTYGDTY
jgi:hypothetical protein